MDTKTLYDLANEADIGFQHDDGYHDATAVWVDGYMTSPEWLADMWVDALAELHSKGKENKLTEVLKDLTYSHAKLTLLEENAGLSVGCTNSFAASLTTANAHLGMDIYGAVRVFVEGYVEQYAEEWWNDCIGYHSDMNEGCREDYEYEQARDRKLDEA